MRDCSSLHEDAHAGQRRCRGFALPWPCAVLAAALVLTGSCSVQAGKIKLNEQVIARWRKELHQPELLYDPLNTRNASDLPAGVPLPASSGWVQHVSWKPRAFIWHNFLTEQEAKHIIKLAVPLMKRSTVVGAGGRSVEDDYRTSYGTFLRRYQDAIVERVENKVAAWTHIPVEHQEDIQVLRYAIGQQYKVHADTIVDPEAGVRVATVLIYLNDAEEGGETAFPMSEWINPELARTSQNFSACAKGHVGTKPKRGDALLFWSIGPDGKTEDAHASHTGCPVIRGAKWTLTKWIHAKPFRPGEVVMALRSKGVPVSERDPGVCEDLVSNCASLANNGGCESNHDYMVVGVQQAGVCRLTCGACTKCAQDDRQCYNENRRKVGFLVHREEELN